MGSSSPGGVRAEEVEDGAESQIGCPLFKKIINFWLLEGFP